MPIITDVDSEMNPSQTKAGSQRKSCEMHDWTLIEWECGTSYSGPMGDIKAIDE